MICDIFITHKPGRTPLLQKCLSTLRECTDRKDYRLHLVFDGNPSAVLLDETNQVDHILIHRENLGLGPSINQALTHIDTLNRWYLDQKVGDHTKIAPFICYLQDDVLVTPGWLPRMSKMFLLLEKQYNLGFASGVECVEHKTRKELGNGMILKDWIRAANMFGRREYWMSMFPIPILDPETGRKRGKPNNGLGSGVDWWFVRNHENSVCRTGRTNLVFPGMMVHAGYRDSTWLDRELPESDLDKQVIAAGTADVFEPCDTYGCKEPKLRGRLFCPSCEYDYHQDPDAYK